MIQSARHMYRRVLSHRCLCLFGCRLCRIAGWLSYSSALYFILCKFHTYLNDSLGVSKADVTNFSSKNAAVMSDVKRSCYLLITRISGIIHSHQMPYPNNNSTDGDYRERNFVSTVARTHTCVRSPYPGEPQPNINKRPQTHHNAHPIIHLPDGNEESKRSCGRCTSAPHIEYDNM